MQAYLCERNALFVGPKTGHDPVLRQQLSPLPDIPTIAVNRANLNLYLSASLEYPPITINLCQTPWKAEHQTNVVNLDTEYTSDFAPLRRKQKSRCWMDTFDPAFSNNVAHNDSYKLLLIHIFPRMSVVLLRDYAPCAFSPYLAWLTSWISPSLRMLET